MLLHKCAAPLGSLHKRLGNDKPELYLFLESKPVGPAALDTYVFARDWRRLALREARASLVCSLQRGWHPLECTKDKANVTEIKTSTILGRWVPISADISQVNAVAFKKILIPTKTTRKAATMRFVVSSLVLDCIKGSYTGVFRGFNLNHVILSLKSKLHLNFTNVPHAVH